MDYDALCVGAFYLYEGERVRLLGKHESLTLGTGLVECYVTIQLSGGQHREALPHELQEEGHHA